MSQGSQRRRRAAALTAPEFTEKLTTFWNGQPTPALRCTVIVGHSRRPTWWCADLEGQQRKAVRIDYAGETFYLDDEDGSGWYKVTDGHGSPRWGSRSLPVERIVSIP